MPSGKPTSLATVLVFAFIVILFCQSYAQTPAIPEGKEKDYDYLIEATRLGNIDPYYHYLLGSVYVEMDSIDAAIRHYSALRLQDLFYSSTLRFMILRNPLGPARLYPDFKYPAALQKIIPSLVNVAARYKGDLKGYGYVGWGYVLDSKGKYYTYLRNYENAEYVRIRVWLVDPVVEERRKWDMNFWGYTVIESKSKFISDEYVIVGTESYEGLVQPEIREEDLEAGEPVILVQNPFMKNNIICTGQITAIRDEPMLGKSFEIEPSGALEKDMILVADTSGRLIGFATVPVYSSSNLIYAFPAQCSSRFMANTEYSVDGIASKLNEIESYRKQNAKMISDYASGKNAVWRGKYEEASEIFDSIIAAHPEEGQAWLYRGFCQWKLGNTEGAIEDFNAASEEDHELAEAQYQLALLYESLNDMDKAEDALKRACGMSKRNPLPHYHLAKYYKECGKKRKFKMEYATLKALDDDLAAKIEE